MMALYLMAMYGEAWIAKESDLFAKPRQWIMQRSTFLAKLLWCWYCVGFWAGVIVYLLHTGTVANFDDFNPFEWLIWGFAGSAASAMGNAVMQRLEWTPTTETTDIDSKENKQ